MIQISKKVLREMKPSLIQLKNQKMSTITFTYRCQTFKHSTFERRKNM